jgi:hypothetical protein
MSISDSSTAGPHETRGRGLDAPFSRSGSASVADQLVSADLAALLDNEVVAITTGNRHAQARRAAGVATRSGDDSGVTVEVAPGDATRPGDAAIPAAARAGANVPLGNIDVPSVRKAMAGAPGTGVEPAVTVSAGQSAEAAPAGRPATDRQGPTTTALTPVGKAAPAPLVQPGAAGTNRSLTAPRQRIGAIVVETAGGSGPTGAQPPPAGGRSVIGPGQPAEVGPMPSPRQLTDQQRAAILASIDPAWLKALHVQIDELYQQISTSFASPPANSEQMLKMLHDARQTLIENPEEYVNAEYRVREVKAMLERTRTSRHDGNRYGMALLLYQVVWAVVLLAGLVMAGPMTAALSRLGSISGPTAGDIFPFWSTMMWGGIGGVVGALYMLWWHVANLQDFDGQYSLWYLVQPLMGLVLGGIMFLVLAGGFLVVQVDLTNPHAATAVRLLPYLVAVLAGFRQNWVYEQLDRLMALFTPAASGPKS